MNRLACESQRHFFIFYFEGQPEFSRVSGDLFVYRDNNRFYDLFVEVNGNTLDFFGGFGDGVWLSYVCVPGWVREGLGLS